MSKILMTGATGFLGHHLIPQLLQAGQQVRAIVRPTSDTTFLQKLGVELAVVPDISDSAAVATACAGCTQVIHAAAHFRFWGDLPSFWQTNVAGTLAVLEAATAVSVERLVYISTAVVVGQVPAVGIIDERTRCRPLDYYQRTKWEAEQVALAFHRERALPVIVLRPGAFYGPWGHYAFNRLFFEEPLRGWRIKVNGGRHITFPTFVPDVAQAIQLALAHGNPGEVYNVCGPYLTHDAVNAIVSDLANMSQWRLNVPTGAVLALARVWTGISRFSGREPYYPLDMAPYVFQDWRVSAAKAEQELGFRPTPFAQGAQTTLAWYDQQGLRPRWR